MGFFLQAVSVREREVRGLPVLRRPSLPRVSRRWIVRGAGIVLGIVVWVLYLYLMVRSNNPWVYVLFGAVGAACGLALATIPALMWDFIRKQVYQILLRQWTDRSRVFATRAQKDLTREDRPRDAMADNDLGVVDFLQANHERAIGAFARAAEAGAAEASANLVAALAETGAWPRLTTLLDGGASLEHVSAEANLARLAAHVGEDGLLQRLWEVAQERQYPILLNNLGVRALRKREYQRAERAFELAIKLRPGYAYAHANEAVLSHRQGHLAQAVTQAASAAGLVEEARIFSNLGALLAMAQDLRAAERWLERAHKLQPRDGAVLVNLGSVHSLNGKAEEAVTALHHAQTHKAFAMLAEYDLGLHFHQLGNLAEALEHFQAAADLHANDADVLNNIGCVYFEKGRYQEAYGLFERVAALDSSDAYRLSVIRAELAAEHPDEAEALIKQSAEPDTMALEQGLVHLLRALTIRPETKTHQQMIEFNLSAAASAFTKAMANSSPAAAQAGLNYGLTQYLRGEYIAAAETFSQALKKGSAHPEMAYLAGMCYVIAGLRARDQHEVKDDQLPPPVRELFLKARPLLEKAAEVQGVAESAAYDLGLLNYLLGEYPRAAEVLRRIARQDSPTYVLNTLALALAKHAQALQFTAQTAALMPEGRKKEVRTQARQLLGASIHYFNQALEAEPRAPLTHANIGLALMLRNHKGDVELALQHWQLMHQHGDARARRTYEEFMQAVSPDAAARLRFQDVEIVFRPVEVRQWVQFPQPRLSGFKYVVHDLLDEPEWRLQARHRLVRKALAYRVKAERIRRRLRRLAI